MKYYPILFATLLCAAINQQVYAQQAGNVKEALSWYTVATDRNGEPEWTNRLSGESIPARASTRGWINYNPAWSFDPASPALRLPLPAGDLSQMHLFSVQQLEGQTGETHLWSLVSDNRTEKVMTDRRVADLGQFEYMNFGPPVRSQPVLSTYMQHEAPSPAPTAEQVFLLGGQPLRKDLPILPFRGLIAEWILFDRQLSPAEQVRVESYLAVKYGLTLRDPQPVDYLRSDGLRIWSGADQPAFHHAVAGIGRDDASGLDQRRSTASEEPDLLTIAWTPSKPAEHPVADGTFLLWGHNDQPLSMERSQPGQMEMLERQWRAQWTGQRDVPTTTLSFERKAIRAHLQPGEQFWLIVDRSGSGDFLPGQVAYYPLSRSENGHLHFEAVRWDTDGSGSDRFTLGKGPAMFSPYRLKAPICDPPTPGSLIVDVAGGQAAYTISLRRQADGATQLPTSQGSVWTFNELESGDYTLLVRDARGQTYQTEVYIESSDSPQPPVDSHYFLTPGEPLTLDAAIDGDGPSVQYRWTGPDPFQSREAVVTIRQAGAYLLEVSRNGCIARRQITIQEEHLLRLQSLDLFPNPTSGRFNLTFELPRPEPSRISVFNAGGQLIDQFRQDAGRVHFYSEELQSAGIYFLKIETGNTSQTIRLVVE